MLQSTRTHDCLCSSYNTWGLHNAESLSLSSYISFTLNPAESFFFCFYTACFYLVESIFHCFYVVLYLYLTGSFLCCFYIAFTLWHPSLAVLHCMQPVPCKILHFPFSFPFLLVVENECIKFIVHNFRIKQRLFNAMCFNLVD